MTSRFSDVLLDDMRTQGDLAADRVIEALFQQHEVTTARRLLGTLVQNDEPPPEALPKEVRDYLTRTDLTDRCATPEELREGQAFFAEHGPMILLCLACYSLPASYAAAKGVTALHRTAYLEERPAKRLFETTQMVIDVMTPGGLEPKGRGVRTAQKVRLMHATVRYFLEHDRENPWPRALGRPINQEDLAGTLMTFSVLVLDGLKRLGIDPGVSTGESYFAAWRSVGRLMGIAEALLPTSLDEARALTSIIQGRQIAPSEEGRLLTRALLEMLEHNVPLPLAKGMPAAMMRHFLPGKVADFLGVPVHQLEALAFDLFARLTGVASEIVEGVPGLERAAYHFGRYQLGNLIRVQEGGRSAPFEIPLELRRRWALDPDLEPTVWQRLFAGR